MVIYVLDVVVQILNPHVVVVADETRFGLLADFAVHALRAAVAVGHVGCGLDEFNPVLLAPAEHGLLVELAVALDDARVSAGLCADFLQLVFDAGQHPVFQRLCEAFARKEIHYTEDVFWKLLFL